MNSASRSSPRGRVAAVFFDFGGTLFSYRRVGGGTGRLIVDAVARLGVAPEPGKIGPAYRDAQRDAYLSVGSAPYYLHRDLFAENWRRFALGLGVEPDPAWVDWLIESQRELVTAQVELREDCLKTLGQLRDAGLHVSIVSNIDDDYLEPMVASAGLADVLHDWTSSEEARSCKPDSAIYHYACRKAGCEPGQVLFVGDSPEQDIAGARAVGMTTALIREPGAAPPGSGVGAAGQPHHEIAELGEVLGLALE